MISDVSLTNFQCFGSDTQHFELRPITLIFGPNGAGKSTIQRAIRLLSQSTDSNALQFTGKNIDLISAGNVKHRNPSHPQNPMGAHEEIKVGLTNQIITKQNSMWEKLVHSVITKIIDSNHIFAPETHINKISTLVGVNSFGVTTSVTVKFESDLPSLEHYFEAASITFTRQVVFEDADDPNSLVQDWRIENPLELPKFLSHIQNHLGQISFPLWGVYDDKDTKLEKLAEITEQFVYFRQPFTPEEIDSIHELFADEFDLTSGGKPAFGYREPFEAGFSYNEQNRVARLLNLYIHWHWSNFQESLRLVEYVPPIREIPSIIETFSESNIGMGRTRKEVSDWLMRITNNRFSYVEEQIPHEGFGLGTTSLSRYVADMHLGGAKVRFEDVGVGLSQVIPVLNSLFNNYRSTHYDSSVLLIEQPELHLHPKMQAELMEGISESILSGQHWQQIILETHSESMVIRLQRLIAQGKVPADLVTVLYVDSTEPDQNGEQVRRLHLDEDGNFTSKWPSSFSELRLRELGYLIDGED